MNEQAMQEEQTKRRRKGRRPKRPQRPGEVWSAVGGLLVGALVISLIFGNSSVGFVLLLASASVLTVGAAHPEARRRLTAFFSSKVVQESGGLAVGALVLAGIFGNEFLMVAVILILTALVFALGVFAPTPPGGAPVRATEPPAEPEPAPVPALPAQAQGEAVSPIDIRALCRGLPPALAGDVFVTVEHLEQAALRAEASGQARAAFDARQSLRDYLPNTVEAWKAQDHADRRAEELAQALAEVRAIADSGDTRAAQRRSWETQQRFLRSRSPDAPLPDPDPESGTQSR